MFSMKNIIPQLLLIKYALLSRALDILFSLFLLSCTIIIFCRLQIVEERCKYYFSSEIRTVKLQWREHCWNHENMFGTGVVQANEC